MIIAAPATISEARANMPPNGGSLHRYEASSAS